MNFKKKIAIVNVLFPPRALGGATRVAVDELAMLSSEELSDEFEVVVFTVDVERRPAYELNVYPFGGVRVYSVSAHINNWIYEDDAMASVFEQFLLFEKPDIVHFHCVQILTGSVVSVAQKHKIPNFVTIHDGWWISDYQFLVDQNGTVYPNGHPDPFAKLPLPDGVSIEQSLKRKSYLKNVLNKATGVFAVSDVFRDVYKKNGIHNVLTNKNGISDLQWAQKCTDYTDKVVCAHIGGMASHKGFDVFKSAVEQLNAPNIEVLIVDHTKRENYIAKALWGKINVTIIGLVDQTNIVSLYQKVDVLFAPSTCPESYGLVTREAAACGCWVVASNLGGIGEDVTASNGFVIEPTVTEILRVMKQINSNPNKYKGVSVSSHVRHTSEQVSELVEVFRQVLN